MRGNRARGVVRRRVSMKVVGGRDSPKHRVWRCSPVDESIRVVRERAGRGFRHVLRAKDVWRFVSLIDDWDRLRTGLSRIRLARGSYQFGYHRPGVLAVRALPTHLQLSRCYLDAYACRLLEHLDVAVGTGPCDGCDRYVDVYQLTRPQARAWLLLDVFLHELGHHEDARSNRSGRAERGERYALEFAERRWRRMWPDYSRAFDI